MADLKGKQNKFLIAMLEEPTTDEAIESANIHRGTAYKYLRDPVFKEALREARKDLVMMVTQKLSTAGEKAVHTLLEVIEDEEAPATSRVSASRTVLEYMYRSYENDELLERIEKLEEMQN